MIDREKVIKGLQCIIDGAVRCESCGYAIDKHGHHSCQQNCASDAIALLKEQEAVEPKRIDGKRNHFTKCGNCNLDLMSGYHYCPRCGKAVKWE